ncbi:MAG: hypothetical protein LC732_12075, partial [Acidobacteria bacterium]|nr:hypothetical protein [Acidobacteriota bacterium]
MLLGALSALGVVWSRGVVLGLVALLVIAAGAVALARRRRSRPGPILEAPRSPAAWIGAAIVGVMVAGHGVLATLAPLGEWDFWSLWGLKAKVFYAHGGIDWDWLARPANAFSHPDYPVLLPLAYDYAAVIADSWVDRELGLLFTALAASSLLLLAAHLRETSGSSLLAATGAVVLAGPVLSLPIGLADLPLLVFGGIALLELRSAVIEGREGRIAIAAAALVLAVLTKNEGVSLAVATTVAILVAGGTRRWKLLVGVVPAGAAALLWVAVRRTRGLGTDLFEGEPLARLAAASPGRLLRALAENPPDHPFFWLALLIAILAAGSHRLARERWLLLAVALQLGFFIGAYLITPRDLDWHVATSWSRLLGQLLLPLGFLGVLFAGEV